MKNKVIRLASIAATVALLGFWSCSNSTGPSGGGSGGSGNPPPNTVDMVNTSFAPSSLTVSKGTTVTWMNSDGITHTSTSDTGVWDTGDVSSATSKTVTFNTAGTFKYHCTIHSNMTGTIVVQ
jgi:plastocyanin